jgi:hypothetical protein
VYKYECADICPPCGSDSDAYWECLAECVLSHGLADPTTDPLQNHPTTSPLPWYSLLSPHGVFRDFVVDPIFAWIFDGINGTGAFHFNRALSAYLTEHLGPDFPAGFFAGGMEAAGVLMVIITAGWSFCVVLRVARRVLDVIGHVAADMTTVAIAVFAVLVFVLLVTFLLYSLGQIAVAKPIVLKWGPNN